MGLYDKSDSVGLGVQTFLESTGFGLVRVYRTSVSALVSVYANDSVGPLAICPRQLRQLVARSCIGSCSGFSRGALHHLNRIRPYNLYAEHANTEGNASV